jgi:hypothetical protein
VTHPTTRREWWAAALAFAVLAVGLVIVEQIGADRPWSELLYRATAAVALGVVAAAIWWASSWLGDHGWRYGGGKGD